MIQGNAFGLIYTGETSLQLRELTVSRSLAAVPFAGRYRCIDFILSNMVNTGVSNVGIIAQKNYHSLMDHLGAGKEWDLHRKRDGLFILPPFVTKENTGIYRGTLDAIRSVMGYIRRSSQRYVILTGSHTIYNTTFDDMLQSHIDTGADITVMCTRAEPQQHGDIFDDLRLTLDDSCRITDMEQDAAYPHGEYSSCDTFVMERTLLEYLVEEAYSCAGTDFVQDVLLKRTGTLRLYGWVYGGYVARLNSIGAYYSHNMAVLDSAVRDDLFCPEHPVYTKIKDEAPAYYAVGASVKDSIVADGCVIRGSVENCVLFRGVRVNAGARLRNCIIMQGSEIQENSSLDYVITDKGVLVKRDRRLAGYESFPVVIRKGSII